MNILIRFLSLARLSFLLLPFPVCWIPAHGQEGRYVPPAFTDPNRRQQVESVLPEIDQLYQDLAKKEHLPGLVYGVVFDGQLIHSRAIGFANVEQKIPAAADTRFRIASMTKSFVAMSALKLRDEGKLQLDDPVKKYLPEFSHVRLPTADSPAITIRHLMTMTTGWPEDNPWADRHIGFTNAELAQIVAGGLSFSNAPSQGYEYSNLGFVLLGKIVTKVSGMRFQDYVTRNILQPLGMKDTVWEYATVPPAKLALGYQWLHETWQVEPMLHDGDAAAMSGLITTLDDFARYVAFHLSADPPRDGPDAGPVRRATLREMHQPRIFSAATPTATLVDDKTPNPTISFYGYGLGWNRDSRGTVKVGHSGGLPGFGSNYRFCPDYSIGVIYFTNLRYGPIYASASQALNLLIEHGKLSPRAAQPSAILLERQQQVTALIQLWDPALGAKIAADNFFLDQTREDWMAAAASKLAVIGKILAVGPIIPENQLRGKFTLTGEKGALEVSFTLTPEIVPKLQALELKAVDSK
jgi:CubicO group peptidase (beta-lactamase class C family)